MKDIRSGRTLVASDGRGGGMFLLHRRCVRCGKRFAVDDEIHVNKARSKYYHLKCWEELFYDG